MSAYTVLGAINETLRALLWSTMQHDSRITGVIATEQQISFEPPFRAVVDAEPNQNQLWLYLYRVVENGDLKNQRLELRDLNQLQYPPLALNLFYLVAPITSSVDNDHLLLGKVLQIFHDNAIARGSVLQGVLSGTTDELRIILNPLSTDDITKLWSAFMRSYRLSVCYEVKVVFIDSERTAETEVVRRKRLELRQKVGV